jgi:tetratricopeptide (TPR) repeat protein
MGKYLAQADAFDAAADLLRQAQRRYAEDFWANYALGMCLIEMQPPRAEEAAGCFRASLAVRPRSFIGHFSLARALLVQQRYAEALAHLKKVDELLDPNDPRRQAWAALTRECERLQNLEGRMPALLARKEKPRDLQEMLTLATLCQMHKRLFGAATQFYKDAFQAQPKLAENVPNGVRYNAACAASLVCCGQGEDADQFDVRRCAELRRQALDWLRADLDFWAKAVATKSPEALKLAAETLRHWQKDSDLAGLRAPAALTKLTAEEQAACRKLWDEVASLLKQTSGK